MLTTRQFGGSAPLRLWSCVRALVAALTLALVQGVGAADPDLTRAELLVQAGKYQEAYELLAPFEDARKDDPQFNYLLGRAALGTKRPDKARALFEQSLAARPDTVAAHLALGRAYFALGRYAEAKIEFETMLRFDNLPPDYGFFGDYRYRLDADNQLTFGALLQRRRYPEGQLRDRSRTLGEVGVGWIRSLFDGRGSFTATAHGGYQYATARSDGNSTIYGVTLNFDYTFTDRLAGFVLASWERDSFNTDRVHFHPDALDEGVILRRKDNEYEFGGGLVWEFVKTWSLRPQILYTRDQSNAVNFNYSATEVWVNVRKAF